MADARSMPREVELRRVPRSLSARGRSSDDVGEGNPLWHPTSSGAPLRAVEAPPDSIVHWAQDWLHLHVVGTKWFDAAIIAAIVAGSVTLAMRDPLDPGSDLQARLSLADLVFLAIFALELILKMFTYGVVPRRCCRTDPKPGTATLSESPEAATTTAASVVPAAAAGPTATPTPTSPMSPARQASRAPFLPAPPSPTMRGLALPGPATPTPPPALTPEETAAAAAAKRKADEEEAAWRRQTAAAHPTYFESSWNWLDFIIVVSGFVDLLPGVQGGGTNAIRMLRVLRPLRTINKLPGLRVIIATVLGSVRDLLQVLVLLMFLFVVYSIIGLQLFSGALRQTCVVEAELPEAETWRDEPRVDPYSLEGFCGLDGVGFECPSNETCLEAAENPGFRTLNFDNFGWAILNVYTVTTLADWSAVMYMVQDTAGAVISPLFFISLILFGTFFAFNLVLAVVVDSYEQNAEEAAALAAADRDAVRDARNIAKKQLRRASSSSSEEEMETDAEKGIDTDEEEVDDGLAEEDVDRAFRATWRLWKAEKTRQELEERRRIQQQESGEEEEDDSRPRTSRRQRKSNAAAAEAAAAAGARGRGATGRASLPRLSLGAGTASAGPSTSSGSAAGPVMAQNPLHEVRSVSSRAGARTDGPPAAGALSGASHIAPTGVIGAHTRPVALSNADTITPLPPSLTLPSSASSSSSSSSSSSTSSGSAAASHRSSLTGMPGAHRASISSGAAPHHRSSVSKPHVSLAATESIDAQLANIQQALERAADLEERKIVRRAVRVVLRADRTLHQQHAWLVGKPLFFGALRDIALHPWFRNFVSVCIVCNTVFLAMDHYRMDASLVAILDVANVVLTSIFAFEMVFKVIAQGPREYVRDYFNCFDAVVVIISLVELIVASVGSSGGGDEGDDEEGGGGGGAISVLRTFRLLRVLKLAKNIKGLRILLVTVIQSLPDMSWITLLLALFVFVFAVLGRQLLAGSFASLPEVPAYNFDTFLDSVLTVFQVLSGDAWPTVMRDSIEATGSPAVMIYFLLLQVFGGYVVLSLFIAILLQRFGEQTDDSLDSEDFLEEALKTRLEGNRARPGQPLVLGSPTEEAVRITRAMFSLRAERKAAADAKRAAYFARDDPEMTGTALGCFTPENPVRAALFRLVTSKWFEIVVLLLIVINCGLLAADGPTVEPGSALAEALAVTDILFTILFALESGVKLVAFGAMTPKHGYFRVGWNVLDFVVVVFSIVGVAFPALTIFRALRALRPLRLVVRSQKIRVVVQALVTAFPNMVNVVGLISVFWTIFAILGVSLFKGAFYACTDLDIVLEKECTGEFVVDPVSNATEPREWVTPYANFDNVGNALVTLFQVATLSDWSSVAHNGMNAVGPGRAPELNANQGTLFFFLAFVIIGSFFSLNLFVGVLLDNFSRLRQELDGSAFLTAEQRQFNNTQRLIGTLRLETRAKAPKYPLRRGAFLVVSHPMFDVFIITVILLNTLFMCMEHFDQTTEWTLALSIADYLFTAVFALEAVLKLLGLGWWIYFRDSWNKFDFAVVLLSIVGNFVNAGAGASVIRVFRIARVFRIIKRAETLRSLLQTLIFSLPSLWNIGSLLFVLFFVFAVLAMNLFGEVGFGPLDDMGITRQSNFATFGDAMLTLWRLATGDAWESILVACSEESPIASPIFFIAFEVFVALILVNLFIAVILENFSESQNAIKEQKEMEKIMGVAKVWNDKYDPLALKLVPACLFSMLMTDAPAPFGFGTSLPRVEILRRFAFLRIPVYQRQASQFRFAHGLVRNTVRALFDSGGLAVGIEAGLKLSPNSSPNTSPASSQRDLGTEAVAKSAAMPATPARASPSGSPEGTPPHSEDAGKPDGKDGTVAFTTPGRQSTGGERESGLEEAPGGRRSSVTRGRKASAGEKARRGTAFGLGVAAAAAEKSAKPRSGDGDWKRRLVWCVEFDRTMNALARAVIELDVTEDNDPSVSWLHEYFAVQIIEAAWVARKVRLAWSSLRERLLRRRVQRHSGR